MLGLGCSDNCPVWVVCSVSKDDDTLNLRILGAAILDDKLSLVSNKVYDSPSGVVLEGEC